MRLPGPEPKDLSSSTLQGVEGTEKVPAGRSRPPVLRNPETTRTGEVLSKNQGHGYEVSRVQRDDREMKRIRALPTKTEINESGPAMESGGARLLAAASEAQPLELRRSDEAISLYLKSLTLNESFDFSLFGPRANQVYVTAVAWDLSGRPPVIFPPPQLDGQGNPTYALRPMDKATFIGDGLQLWPSTQVVGGLNVQLIVMESDGNLRKLGETMEAVRKSVQDSSLVNLLATLASGPTAGAVTAALNAGAALTGVIAEVLQRNGDDLVGVFQGTYGAELMHESKSEHYDQRGASIDLDFHTQPVRADQ